MPHVLKVQSNDELNSAVVTWQLLRRELKQSTDSNLFVKFCILFNIWDVKRLICVSLTTFWHVAILISLPGWGYIDTAGYVSHTVNFTFIILFRSLQSGRKFKSPVNVSSQLNIIDDLAPINKRFNYEIAFYFRGDMNISILKLGIILTSISTQMHS